MCRISHGVLHLGQLSNHLCFHNFVILPEAQVPYSNLLTHCFVDIDTYFIVLTHSPIYINITFYTKFFPLGHPVFCYYFPVNALPQERRQMCNNNFSTAINCPQSFLHLEIKVMLAWFRFLPIVFSSVIHLNMYTCSSIQFGYIYDIILMSWNIPGSMKD